MLIAKLTGYILQATGSYVPVFLIAASAYLVALGVIHLLVPRLEPAALDSVGPTFRSGAQDSGLRAG